jgi:hypothetical protein
MHFSKKISFTVSSLIAMLTVAACSSGNPGMSTATIDGNVNFSKANIAKPAIVPVIEKVVKDELSDEHVFIDVGNGQKTGASFTVGLNFNAGAFKTKAATNNNGFDGTITAVKSVRVWLREGDVAFSPGTSNLPTGTNQIAVFNYDRQTTGSPLLTFTNVNASSTAPIAPTSSGNNGYFVAVAAYNDTIVGTHGGVVPANNVNANNSATDNASAVIAGEQTIFAKTGGDSNGGHVHVNADFTVTSFSGLVAALVLKNAVGASIATDVNFTAGSPTYTGPVVGVGAN